jgi:hypothetical protein
VQTLHFAAPENGSRWAAIHVANVCLWQILLQKYFARLSA